MRATLVPVAVFGACLLVLLGVIRGWPGVVVAATALVTALANVPHAVRDILRRREMRRRLLGEYAPEPSAAVAVTADTSGVSKQLASLRQSVMTTQSQSAAMAHLSTNFAQAAASMRYMQHTWETGEPFPWAFTPEILAMQLAHDVAQGRTGVILASGGAGGGGGIWQNSPVPPGGGGGGGSSWSPGLNVTPGGSGSSTPGGNGAASPGTGGGGGGSVKPQPGYHPGGLVTGGRAAGKSNITRSMMQQLGMGAPGGWATDSFSRYGPAQPEPDLVIGDVTGYRWWTLPSPDLGISPAFADEHWPFAPLHGMRAPWSPGINRAICLSEYARHDLSTEPIPAENCGCGFWAYWSPGYHDVGTSPQQLPVVGVISGTGRTLIGERGFRCAKAEIIAVYLPFVIQAAPPPGDPWKRAGFRGDVMYYGYAPEMPKYPDPAEMKAAADTAEAWVAVIGDRIERMYPGVDVCETLDKLLAKYPPDPNYSPFAGG